MSHKYQAKRVTVDGHQFASKAEARRYGELKLLERAGKIAELMMQPRFIVFPAFERNGRKIREITYVADFQYLESGRVVVEDVKGVLTPLFKLKWKLFLAEYPFIDARIVKT